MSLHLLLAEDEKIAAENLAHLLQKRLGDLDVAVHVTHCGREALERVESHPEISMAVLDVRMPGMDGVELLSRLREKRPDIACIMLTGYDTPVCRLESRRWGARDFLAKPVELDALTGAIKRLAARN